MPTASSASSITGDERPHFRTMTAMFEHAVATVPDATALWQDDRSVSYAQLADMVQRLAADLARRNVAGETVGLLLPNSIEFVVAYFATLFAGGLPTLLNPAYPARQLHPILKDAALRIIFCTVDTVTTLDDLDNTPDAECRIILDATFLNRRTPQEDPFPTLTINPDDPAALLYTGGTTGTSKGVEHSHLMLADAVRAIDWIWPSRAQGDVWLPVAPMFHIYGFVIGVLTPILGCGKAVILGPFKPDRAIALMADHKVTIFGGGPPAIYNALLGQPAIKTADLAALRLCPAGGAPFPVELIDRWRRATGITIQEGYGMTEMAPISGNTDIHGVKPGTVGVPVPGCAVEVVDLEHGNTILPPNSKGEIRVRGPHAMRGYRNRPDETAKTMRNGFIYTGDIGVIDDDGFISITDRKKDVILVHGYNVFPRDVEELVFTHPAVRNVGVIGIPDERTGERVVAFIVADQAPGIAAEITALCEQNLAPYQQPADYRFVDNLPITPANKLDRVALRQIADA